MPTYSRIDVVFERGEGPYIYATDGRRFLDFTAGIAVNALGHAHPHLVNALTEQAKKLWHTSNLFRVEGQETLGRRLAEATFADTMFFCNSGTEAWELGVKLVRKYHYEAGNTKRHRIITFEQAFHGRSTGAISASNQEKMVKGFGPLLPGFDIVPFGDLDAVRAAITDETAAIAIEPIQGEGGIRSASAEFLRGLRALCDEHGLLFFLDEIQSGMGRTGKLFAHEWAGVTPDVMTVAKGIGGGFPLGALLATEKAASGMTAGTHGSTYGGNPLAMAVGNAVLDVVLAPGFLDGVQRTGDRLQAALRGLIDRHPAVFTELRGHGLLLGLKCAPANLDVVAKARGNGMLIVPAGDNVVRLLPPLNIEDAHIEEAVAILDKTAREFAA
ncbi:aspartate aminotransferase family protein [Azospirillum sp. SYSU D00513]|uniref:aspartate aminotransferase family protein n=1 Tax=Azospirillum sp. SYSU D00513 TaxID=2812561 RepID=UPI001A976FBA|nr:aspartate aminotransferase family protein [Azospirillum sp. SYSU D00513]